MQDNACQLFFFQTLIRGKVTFSNEGRVIYLEYLSTLLHHFNDFSFIFVLFKEALRENCCTHVTCRKVGIKQIRLHGTENINIVVNISYKKIYSKPNTKPNQ